MTGQQVHRQQQQYQQQAQQTSGGGSHQPHQLMAPNRSPQRGRANSEAQSVQHHVNMSAAKRAAAQARRSAAADAMSLERLLRDGPPDGDVSGALESTRLKILDGGIKSDSDGMVGIHLCSHEENWLTFVIVEPPHICLAHPPLSTYPQHKRLSGADSPWGVSSLLKDPQRHVPDADDGPALPASCLRGITDPAAQRRRLETARCA